MRLLQPSKSTSTDSATSVSTSTSGTTSSTDDTSTVLSSMWSEKRRQMYHMMTPDEQELFDELQREIEELRKLLGGKNKKVSDQVRFFTMISCSLTNGPSASVGRHRNSDFPESSHCKNTDIHQTILLYYSLDGVYVF